MSLPHAFLNLTAFALRLGRRAQPQVSPENPRILVIRRHRMGDMIYTLPLLHALRQRYPQAHLTIACDPPGASIARACSVVNKVIVLKSGWNRWLATISQAARLQNHDWVIAAKGGFDRRLAVLTRLTNGATRIGFEPGPGGADAYYTHPVAMAADPHREHQIETLFRLLEPLGLTSLAFDPATLRLTLPQASRAYAEQILSAPPFGNHSAFALINISCNRPVKFTMENYATLIQRLLETSTMAVGIVSTPDDQPKARDLASPFSTERVAVLTTPGTLDLAALLERARIFITPEGGAAHLSSATQTPTVVLWSGHYGKWRPRGERHLLVEKAPKKETSIPVERAWEAVSASLSK
jgi:ADP-heptose:LPS heptosyltransferase